MGAQSAVSSNGGRSGARALSSADGGGGDGCAAGKGVG